MMSRKKLQTPKSIALPSSETLSNPAQRLQQAQPAAGLQVSDGGESVITAANRLLTDLKKAYTQVLQEKEEQIYSLREEIVDLKTLIKVLESENARLHERQ